jgi:hypothetical protein
MILPPGANAFTPKSFREQRPEARVGAVGIEERFVFYVNKEPIVPPIERCIRFTVTA